MKKVLFATTALVATAGVAAADVTFGGYGRFGILYSSAAGANGIAQTFADDGVDAAGVPADSPSSIDITSRFRLQIDATAESDGGVVFGARVRIEQENDEIYAGPAGVAPINTADGSWNSTGINGPRFFARSGGLEVGVGNIFGAIEFMPGMYPIDLGLTGLSYEYTPYMFGADFYDSDGQGAGGTINAMEVMYSAGDLSLHVSASDGANNRVAAYVAYVWNGWTFAIGGQDSDNPADTDLALSVSGNFGPAMVSLAFADNGTRGDHVTLAARFDVGAATNIEAYISDADTYFGTPTQNTGYGIDFNHDLGGGTSLRGGVAKLFAGHTVADLGVRFNF